MEVSHATNNYLHFGIEVQLMTISFPCYNSYSSVDPFKLQSRPPNYTSLPLPSTIAQDRLFLGGKCFDKTFFLIYYVHIAKMRW
ncbi:hypothetical protein BH09BAC1_BH09BAC1_11120 [soil metagenome]